MEKAKAKVEERLRVRVDWTHRETAPMKDGLMTWSRTCPKEKTPWRRLLDRRGRRDTPTGIPWQRVLSNAFSKLGGPRWPRNCEIASNAPRAWVLWQARHCLGSLWDDDNDTILGQVADDRSRKGMVQFSKWTQAYPYTMFGFATVDTRKTQQVSSRNIWMDRERSRSQGNLDFESWKAQPVELKFLRSIIVLSRVSKDCSQSCVQWDDFRFCWAVRNGRLFLAHPT